MNNNNPLSKLSFLTKITFLVSCFLVCFFLVVILFSVLSQKYGLTNNIILSQIALQNLLAFTLPAIIVTFFLKNKPFNYLGLNFVPPIKTIIFIVLLYFASIPLMNMLIEINENIKLPESFSVLEDILRAQEEAAQAVTNRLINGISFLYLLVLILVVGILTGFGEEIFFRGILFRLFIDKPMNKHIAIWAVAFIFSLMHFQFYGFLPRMILGAIFGYLLLWTGNLWVPIICHALNNSLVLISNFLIENRIISENYSTLGSTNNMWWLAIVSAIVVAILIKYKNRFLQSKPGKSII